MEDKQIELMTPKELKAALKSRKMSTKGTREELIERLKVALEAETDDSELSDSGSEGVKTPRSHVPRQDKDIDADDFAPVSERPDVEEPPLHVPRITTTEQELDDKLPDEDVSSPHELGGKDSTVIVTSSTAIAAAAEMSGGVVAEWRSLHVSDEWLPMPLIRVSNLPTTDFDLEILRNLLEKNTGVKLAHLTLEVEKPGERSISALARLRPPKELLFSEGVTSSATDSVMKSEEECDVRIVAENTVKKLRTMDLTLGQKKLDFEAPLLHTTLFVHNLEESYKNKDENFKADMMNSGTVIRCFIVRNSKGESKDYGFVEFLLPSEALIAKEALDKKSAQALSDFKKARGSSGSIGSSMVPLKRLRCEWAFTSNISSMYSKICYVSNLQPNFEDREMLRSVFSPYGNVLSCNTRTRMGLSPGCGFVDFERGEDAEKALRALDGRHNAKLGLIHVSFVNPGKFPGEVQQSTSNTGSASRQSYQRRPRDNSNNGLNEGNVGYHLPNRNNFFNNNGRPSYDMQRGRNHRTPRGKTPRGNFPPPYQNYNQGMYTPYYASYGPQGFVHPGYYTNGGSGAAGYHQFAPQGPNAGFAPNYGTSTGYRGPPSVPGGKVNYTGLTDQEYPTHGSYGGVPYTGGSSYNTSGASHLGSAAGSYGQQGLTQSGYPSSYGAGYHAASGGGGYGQTNTPAAAGGGGGYLQHSGTFNQQQGGSYSQLGYSGYGGSNGGATSGGNQLPGAKREHDYDTSSYGAPHYGKKPRY
eukprot:g2405.t1